jgi:hypothetical protein
MTPSRQFVEAQLMSHASTILPGDACGINQDSAFNSNACRDRSADSGQLATHDHARVFEACWVE